MISDELADGIDLLFACLGSDDPHVAAEARRTLRRIEDVTETPDNEILNPGVERRVFILWDVDPQRRGGRRSSGEYRAYAAELGFEIPAGWEWDRIRKKVRAIERARASLDYEAGEIDLPRE